MKIALALFLGILHAQNASAAACSTTGLLQYTGGVVQYCDGSVWQNAYKGALGAGCGTAGLIQYTGGVMQFCDGSNYYVMQGPVLSSCAGTAAGTITATIPTRYCDGSNWYPMDADAFACAGTTLNNCVLVETNSGSSYNGTCALGYAGACSYSCLDSIWTQVSNTCVAQADCTSTTINHCVTNTVHSSQTDTGSCATGYLGACSYSCNNGTWSLVSNSCSPTTAPCSSQTINYCSVTGGVHGSNSGACIVGYEGACNYTCNNGTWVQNVNGCALGSNCSAQTINNCALLTTGDTGTSGTCAANYSGSCSFTCNNGSWSQTSNSCADSSTCSTQTINYCYLPGASHGTSEGSCIAGYEGACSFTCSVGSWNQNSNSCALGANCNTTIISGCQLNTTGDSGSDGTCATGYSGACSYKCNNGTWSQTSNSCSALASCAAQNGHGNASCDLPHTTSGVTTDGSCWTNNGTCNATCNNGTWSYNWNTCH